METWTRSDYVVALEGSLRQLGLDRTEVYRLGVLIGVTAERMAAEAASRQLQHVNQTARVIADSLEML